MSTANLLPTLPGHVHGIVGRDPWQIQCDGCGAIETPAPLVLMRTTFQDGAARVRAGDDSRRLCPDCQKAAGWVA